MLITHSLQEAVLLSDKVLVLSARPSTIKEQINISLPKKRTIDLMGIQQFIHYENLLRDYLKEEPSLIEPLK